MYSYKWKEQNMLSKKFVYMYMFLLVLLLSMGTVWGQYNYGPMAVTVAPTETGLKVSSLQVDQACVPGYAQPYQVWKYSGQNKSLVPITTTPSIPIGGMAGRIGGSFYFYPLLKWLPQAGLGGLWLNGGEVSGIYMLSPYAPTREVDSCSSSMVYHGEMPLLIMGGLTEYPAVFRGQGAAVKEVHYDFLNSRVAVDIVGFHRTRVVVYEKTEDQLGREATRQQVFSIAGTGGVETIEFSLSVFGPEVRAKNKVLYIHLLDEETLLSTNKILVDWNMTVLDEKGNYIPSPEFRLLVGDDKK